jgi:hypothetical protein
MLCDVPSHRADVAHVFASAVICDEHDRNRQQRESEHLKGRDTFAEHEARYERNAYYADDR